GGWERGRGWDGARKGRRGGGGVSGGPGAAAKQVNKQSNKQSRPAVPSSSHAHAAPARPAAKAPPPLMPIDRKLKQRLARGQVEIDARLDLHGRTLSEAHVALLRFLHRAQGEGAGVVLVVTGKCTGERE